MECSWCGAAEPLVEDLPQGGQEIWPVYELTNHEGVKEAFHDPCYKTYSGYYEIVAALKKAKWTAKTFLMNVDLLTSELPEEHK